MGYDQQGKWVETQAKMRLGVGDDPRAATARMQQFTIENVNAVTEFTPCPLRRRNSDVALPVRSTKNL